MVFCMNFRAKYNDLTRYTFRVIQLWASEESYLGKKEETSLKQTLWVRGNYSLQYRKIKRVMCRQKILKTGEKGQHQLERRCDRPSIQTFPQPKFQISERRLQQAKYLAYPVYKILYDITFDFTKGKVNKRTNIVCMFYIDQESTSQKVRNKRDSGKFSQIETRFFHSFHSFAKLL